MNTILHKAHSSSNKHTPALPLALVGNSCLKNFLPTICQHFYGWHPSSQADDLRTSRSPSLQKHLGWQRRTQRVRAEGWALFSLAPLSIVWHDNKASDLISPLSEGATNSCTYYTSHFLNSTAPAAMERSVRASSPAVQRYLLSLSSSLDSPQIWKQAEPMGYFLERISESPATALAEKTLGTC